MKITPEVLAELARYNAGIARAREAYDLRDVPVFADCPHSQCGPDQTCHRCRRRARKLLVAATSEDECADLLAIIDRPGIRSLRPCGTLAAYRRHQRHGERICPPCRLAYNEYQRRYLQGRRP